MKPNCVEVLMQPQFVCSQFVLKFTVNNFFDYEGTEDLSLLLKDKLNSMIGVRFLSWLQFTKSSPLKSQMSILALTLFSNRLWVNKVLAMSYLNGKQFRQNLYTCTLNRQFCTIHWPPRFLPRSSLNRSPILNWLWQWTIVDQGWIL